MIGEHLESAGDLHAAFNWHMRAATWATNRDIAAAYLSWERAIRIAYALPAGDPDRAVMRIAPRTMLCGIAWRVHEQVAGARFEELRQLCTAAGDKSSLAIGMAGLVIDHAFQGRMREASQLASLTASFDSVGDTTLTVGLSFAPIWAKGEGGEWRDVLRWSQAVIDLADGDPSKGNFIMGSPLAFVFTARGDARYALGHPGWRHDLRRGLAMARSADAMSYTTVVTYVYWPAISIGVLESDDSAVRDSEDALRVAEQSGDDLAVAVAQMALGIALVHGHMDEQRDRGQQLLAQVGDVFVHRGHNLCDLALVQAYSARERARAAIAMPLYRSCAPPSTICSGKASCCGTAFPRPVF